MFAQVASAVDAIKVATGASSDCQVYTGIAVALVLIWFLNVMARILHVDGGKLDAASRAILKRILNFTALQTLDGLDIVSV